MNLNDIKRLYDDHLVREYGTCAIGVEEFKFLVKQAEDTETLSSQVDELICCIYEYANEGTALMELAKKIDSESK